MSRKKSKKAPQDAPAECLHGSGLTVSPWMRGGIFERRALTETIDADVCVIGGGVAGLTAAYRLACAGKDVVVLEDGDIAGGETSRSTAHLSTALSKRYARLEELYDEPTTRLVAESHAAAIDFMETTAREEAIDCDFMRLNGYLFWPQDGDLKEINDELAACERAGLPVEKLESAPISFWNSGPCLRFARQAQLDPQRYASGLARAAARRGARIFTRSHARLLSGAPLRVRSGAGAVIAKAVVIATNAPIDDMISISTRQAAYRTYALAAELPAGAFSEPLLLWDTVDPYHYVRVAPPQRGETSALLIVGGEDHKVGHAEDAAERWQRLEAWARARFPMMGAISHRWSGQVQESVDGLAFIGRHPTEEQAVYVVTGDCGSGMTSGTIGGLLVCDEILGKSNHWESIYDPSRLPLSSAFEFVAGTLDAAAQYLRYYAGSGDVASEDQVPPGCGAVLHRGLAPVAVYRAEDGTLVERSAVCPHLGGVVCWNQAERTWDCPVHGSRFSPSGEVLSGPANDELDTPAPPLPRHPSGGAWAPPP